MSGVDRCLGDVQVGANLGWGRSRLARCEPRIDPCCKQLCQTIVTAPHAAAQARSTARHPRFEWLCLTSLKRDAELNVMACGV